MGTLSYLARRFVAGESMPEAIAAVEVLNRGQIAATLDILGENVESRSVAMAAADQYIALLDAIDQHHLVSNVSLKLTQMGLDVSQDLCVENLTRILDRAKTYNNFVRIDMEGSAYTQQTLDVFLRLFEKFDNVGIVLQAYLHRTEGDARMLGTIQAPVRVCKGAYKEKSSVAFSNMKDIRANFNLVTQTLLEAGSKVAIATHDEELIRTSIDWTKERDIAKDRFEFQMLYGLRRKRWRELVETGYDMRSYVPFGSHWLPYFVRRLRERKENIFFVLKSLITG